MPQLPSEVWNKIYFKKTCFREKQIIGYTPNIALNCYVYFSFIFITLRAIGIIFIIELSSSPTHFVFHIETFSANIRDNNLNSSKEPKTEYLELEIQNFYIKFYSLDHIVYQVDRLQQNCSKKIKFLRQNQVKRASVVASIQHSMSATIFYYYQIYHDGLWKESCQ